MIDRHPVAYIRRSTADAGSPGDISREVQEAAIDRLAARDGHNGDVRRFVDWARSADEEKEAARTEFRALLAELEAGRVSTIYAYSLDRLARSTATFARLLKACKDNDVRVVTEREGDLSDDGNVMKWAFGLIVSFFAEFELRLSKARAAGTRERRLARGDAMGRASYGFRSERVDGGRIVHVQDADLDLEPVRAAYLEAGTITGAARILNASGVPGPRGGTWHASLLRRTLDRHWPGLVPAHEGRGRPVERATALSRLVRCHCGHLMTPNSPRSQLYCSHSKLVADHGRMSVQEAPVLAYLRDRFEEIRLADIVEMEDDPAGRREAIEERLERANELYLAGAIDRTRHAAEREKALEDLEKIDTATTRVRLEPIDWDATPPAELNAVLRAAFRYVQMDREMKPVEAVLQPWLEEATAAA